MDAQRVGFLHNPYNRLKNSLVAFKIRLAEFEYYNWCFKFRFQVFQVGVLDFLQVGRTDVALDVAAAFLYLPQQYVHRAVQVKQQIRFGKGSIQYFEKLLEQAKFLFPQVVFCEQEGFHKKIIGYRKLLKEIGLRKMLLQLFVSLRHKKQFDGKSVPFRLEVKKRQKRIVGKLLQHQFAIELRRQPVAECRLAGPDVAFDGDEIVGNGHGGGWRCKVDDACSRRRAKGARLLTSSCCFKKNQSSMTTTDSSLQTM